MSSRSVPTPAPFALTHRLLDDGTSVVVLQGDLDMASAPNLKWKLADLVSEGRRRFVIDVSQVGFMDSTALGVLIGLNVHLPADGVLAIAGATPTVVRLFEVTGLDRTYELFPTVDAAVADLDRVSRSPIAAPTAATPAAPAEEHPPTPVPSTGERARPGASLTDDAAVVLGIATTAMPFAGSSRAQFQRWLRALCQRGDAAVALAALGITDDSIESGEEYTAESGNEVAAQDDPVRTIAQQARRIADARGASATHTTDLLAAVANVYGAEFGRLVIRHGITLEDVLERVRPHTDDGGAEPPAAA